MIVDHLKVFVTVVDQQNFSKAAEELFISQPAVSVHIRNLENELGCKLINRTSKQLILTQAGEILYRNAKQMLKLYDDAKIQINDLKSGITGTLKIGASFTIGEYILPRVLAEYVEQYPNVNVEVSIANTEEVLQAVKGGIDLGLVEGQVTLPELKKQSFVEDEMVIIVPVDHHLAKQRVISNTDILQDQTWILREVGSGTRAFSETLIQDLNLRVKRTYVFSSSQGVKESVITGLGIALVSSFIVHKEVEKGELIPLRIKGRKIVRKLFYVQRRDMTTSKVIAAFVEKIKEYGPDTPI